MGAFLIVLVDLLLVGAAVQGIGWSFHEYVFPDAPFGFVGATVNSVAILLLVLFGNYAVSVYDRDVLVTRAGLFSRIVVMRRSFSRRISSTLFRSVISCSQTIWASLFS